MVCQKCNKNKKNKKYFKKNYMTGFYAWCMDCMEIHGRSPDLPLISQRGGGQFDGGMEYLFNTL